MINSQRPKYPVLTAFIIIFLLGIFYNWKTLDKFPYNIHAWTQADRYALAKGFLNNGLNFFKPETFIFNQQYPENNKVKTEESITSVDFPLHDFVPAVIMKLLNTETPVIFRVYILLYSIIGMLFLFKLSFLWIKSFYKSLFVAVFAATSPVFVYYSGGFLPTIPSLANSIIGIYFYSLYLHTGRNKDFSLSILFLTLSALSRTTFVISLVAVLGLELIRTFQRKNKVFPKIIPVLFSFLIILGYYFYNGYLRSTYGSIFLNYLIPAKSFEDAIDILAYSKNNWGKHYFNINHYNILVTLFLLMIYTVIFRKTLQQNRLSGFLQLFVLMFIGNILFVIAMLSQFRHHDYYFLDSLYLPTIFLLILVLGKIRIPDQRSFKYVVPVMYILACIFMINKTGIIQRNRLKPNLRDNITKTAVQYENADKYLDSLHIPIGAKILVLDGTSPNIALTRLNRKGFSLMFPNKSRIQTALKWDYDYIVYENDNFLSSIFSYYPEITKLLKKIDDNGKITVCERMQSPIDQPLYRFIGIENKKPQYISHLNLDSPFSSEWHNIKLKVNDAYTGENSAELEREKDIFYETEAISVITQRNTTLLLTCVFKGKDAKALEASVVIKEGRHIIFDKTQIFSNTTNLDQWKCFEVIFNLPSVKEGKDIFRLNIKNTSNEAVYIDDLKLLVY